MVRKHSKSLRFRVRLPVPRKLKKVFLAVHFIRSQNTIFQRLNSTKNRRSWSSRGGEISRIVFKRSFSPPGFFSPASKISIFRRTRINQLDLFWGEATFMKTNDGLRNIFRGKRSWTMFRKLRTLLG